MQAPNGKPLWARSGRSPWFGVVDAVVGCVLAGTLVIVAAVFSAPDLVAELFGAVAVVIVITSSGQLPAAIRSLRQAKNARRSPELAELRSHLAKLPETRHPLGL